MDRKMLVGVLYLASNMPRPTKVKNHYKNSALFLADIENLILIQHRLILMSCSSMFLQHYIKIVSISRKQLIITWQHEHYNTNIQFIVSGMSN